MTTSEWQLIAAILENAWKGDWDDARSLAYYALLEPFEAPHVERALHIIVRNGSPWIPAVAEIIAAIESGARAAVPTWPEAWAATLRAIRRYGRSGEGDALEHLQAVHPLVAAWAATHGWARLCGEEVEHPRHGGAVLKRLEESYAAHVERQQDRERQGIALGTVERRTLTGGGPRRLDPARMIGAPGGAA